MLRDQRPIQIERYSDLEPVSPPALAEHAVIGVPIWWAGQMIGYLGLSSPPPRRFTADESETLALLARHAAIAIENARRYERERQMQLANDVAADPRYIMPPGATGIQAALYGPDRAGAAGRSRVATRR